MLLALYNSVRMEMNSGTILGYFLQALPIASIVGVVFLIIRLVLRRRENRRIKWGQEILRVIFVCYLTGLISLVVLPANFWLYVYGGIFFGWWEEMGPVFQLGGVNLVPTLLQCLTGELSLGSWMRTMLIGNVAMFVPFGLLLPLVTGIKGGKRLVLAAVFVPACFEVAQLIFGRSLDVDDLICNFLGMVIGMGIAWAILRARPANRSKSA